MYEEYIKNKTVVTIRYTNMKTGYVEELTKAVILESDNVCIVAVVLNKQFTQTKNSPVVAISEKDIISVITYYPPTKNNRKPIVAKLINLNAYSKAKSSQVAHYIMGVMAYLNFIVVAKNPEVKASMEAKVNGELSMHYNNLTPADKCMIQAKAKFHGFELPNN